MASESTQPTAALETEELPVVMTLEGHTTAPDIISYFPDGKQIISGSRDKTVRRWDLEEGKEVEEARDVYEQQVTTLAVSRDGRWVITSTITPDLLRDHPRKIIASEVETGTVKTFEIHSRRDICIDISVDSKLLASGSGNAVWIWRLDTGKSVACPLKTHSAANRVRFSPDSKKLAVAGWGIEVWDIQAQKLDAVMTPNGRGWAMVDVPIFWTTNRTIVAPFTWLDVDYDHNQPWLACNTINEFDASESTLEIIGASFEHTDINGIALSFDCALLASSSYCIIKLWAFDSRQLLASFYVHDIWTRNLILSHNSRQLAYTVDFESSKIYICDIPPDILHRIWPNQATLSTIAPGPEYSHTPDLLNSDATRRRATVRRNLMSLPPAPQPSRPSPTIYPQQPTFVHRLRNLLPSSFRRNSAPLVQTDEPHDPLDIPAVLRLPPNPSPPTQTATRLHSGTNPSENVRHSHAVTQSPRTSHKPPIVAVAAGRKFTRLSAVNLPEYRKINDTRRSSAQKPAVSQGTAVNLNDPSFDSSDNDSLPDVHWCKALFCYFSCWSHGTLRMPPRWRLERLDEPHDSHATSSITGQAHACS